MSDQNQSYYFPSAAQQALSNRGRGFGIPSQRQSNEGGIRPFVRQNNDRGRISAPFPIRGQHERDPSMLLQVSSVRRMTGRGYLVEQASDENQFQDDGAFSHRESMMRGRGRGVQVFSQPMNQPRLEQPYEIYPQVEGPMTQAQLDILAPMSVAGSTYTIFSGTFGFQTNVFVKQAKLGSYELVEHEKKLFQTLRPCAFFPVYMSLRQSSTHLYMYQERYEQNCEAILGWFSFNNNGGAIPGFCVRKFFTEVWSGIKFLHGRNMVHRNIRAKNIYVQVVNGKMFARERIYDKNINPKTLFSQVHCERLSVA